MLMRYSKRPAAEDRKTWHAAPPCMWRARPQGTPLTAIAEFFGLSHYGRVSGSNSRFETRMKQDKPLARIVDRVNKTINKQT